MSSLEDSIQELNENRKQQEAFEVCGNCVVLAPPGSGKTKLLATRLARDLLVDIEPPGGAACITLTNAAAGELRTRLRALGVRQRSNLFVGTVHSFALNRIVVPFAGVVGTFGVKGKAIASDREVNSAFSTAIQDRWGSSNRWDARSTVEVLRRRFAGVSQWNRAGNALAVLQRYRQILEETGKTDFDSIIEEAVEIVEGHPSVRRVLQSKYRCIFVDEYQDLAPGLNRLVQALVFGDGKPARLFAVGDPDQAVMSFTGADVGLLRDLSNRADVTCVKLEQNYRCGQEIIRVANLSLRGSRSMWGARPGGVVRLERNSGGIPGQAAAVAEKIGALVRSGESPGEIAVICPFKEHAKVVDTALASHGIDSVVRTDAYRVTQATAMIENAAAWCTQGRQSSGHPLTEILGAWDRFFVGTDDVKAGSRLVSVLLAYDQRPDAAAADFIAELAVAGLREQLSQPRFPEELVAFETMQEALTRGDLARAPLKRLAELATNPRRVEVSTYQSSKGREFDSVFIMGLDQKQVPFFAAIGDDEKMDEERRKFYVALTRARKRVDMHYSGFVTWKNGSHDPAGPSQFLKEIGYL